MVARLAIAVAGCCMLLCGCGGASSSTVSTSTTSAAQLSSTTPPATTATRTTTAPRPRPRPDPGRLPQTGKRPSARTPGFHAEMSALWAGIRTGSLRPAMPAFFPEGAYIQLKTLYDASADYQGRLVGDFLLDIDAAHALLGAGAADAHLLAIRVPAVYAHWVDPGVCDNRVGYYEVPNARVVYREDGQVRSFGIASMISWRGAWYVVHLGTVVRSAAVGTVDDPSAGPGESAPSTTC